MEAFPHLHEYDAFCCIFRLTFRFRAQVQVIVGGFFTLDQDAGAFKNHMRDFLVQCKVRSAPACISLSHRFPAARDFRKQPGPI